MKWPTATALTVSLSLSLSLLLCPGARAQEDEIGPLMRDGTKAMEAENFPRAIELFEKATRVNPHLLATWLNLGELYMLEARYGESQKAYRAALPLAQDRFPIDCELARIESWQGHHEKAEELYRQLTLQRPFNLEARLGLAEALENLDRAAEAQAVYDEILARQSDNPQALVAKAKLLGEEHLQAAFGELDRLLTLDPSNPEARIAKARLFMGESQWSEAREEIDRVLRTHPDSAEAYRALAQLRRWQGYDDQAEQAMLGGLRWAPQNRPLRKDLKLLRMEHAPTLEPLLTRFRDNDGNRLDSVGGRFSFDLDRLNRLSLFYENRSVSNPNQGLSGQAQIAQLGWNGRLDPDLVGQASLGFTTADPSGSGSGGTGWNGGLGLAWSPTQEDTIRLSANREILTDTAQLLQNRVALDQIGLNYRHHLSPVDELEVAYYRGFFSDDNGRNLYTASYFHDFQKTGPRIALGATFRGLNYDHLSSSGYFSPSQYQATQAVLRIDNHRLDSNDRWLYSLEAGVGVQSGNQLLTSFSGSLGYRIDDSLELEASALRSNSAAGSTAGFTYNTQTLRLLIRF